MKKIFALILGICILVQASIISLPAGAASSSVANLDVSTENVFAGDAVYVTVSLTSNPGLTYVKLKVSYDTNTLTLFGIQNGEIINDLTRGSSYVWSATDTTTTTGTFATLIFSVSEDASAGTYPVTITCVEAYNNESDVSVNIQNGSITVNAEECVHDMESISYQEPTCKKEGSRVLKCTKCDYSETVTFDKIDCVAENEADCINDAKCKYCGNILESAYGHKYRTQVIAPTTTDEGYTLYTCMRCGDSYQDNILPPVDDSMPVVGVILNKTSETLKIGNSVSLIATVTPSNATNKNVTWGSSDTSIASVVNGVVTANKAGTATITATTEDGGFIAQCMVVVNGDQEQIIPVTGITLSKEKVVLKVDELEFVDAIILPDNATNKKVIWKSSDLSVVDIAWSGENNLNGLIVARNAGKATITATTEDGNFVAQCEVTVNGEDNSIPVTGITLSESSVTLNIGDYQVISASLLPSDATNTNVIWTSDNPAVASLGIGVDDKTFAVIQAESTGTATITATTANGGFKATCVVVVTEREKTIVGYKWYADALRHKVIYSDDTYDMEDCAPADCVCGRQYNDTPDISAAIEISSVATSPGETIAVHVKISDNPGLASLVLDLSFDQSLLTLTNVEYNPEMGGQAVPPASMTSPVKLYWVNGFADYTEEGCFATLTFAVSEEAKEGDSTEITVSYTADDVFNANDENVQLNIMEGRVTVTDHIAGDINGDGNLNNKDVTRFMQYNAGWDVEVNEEALDVNGDGSINNKDVTRLMQYIADWDVEIH